MGTRLYVGNLPFSADEEQVRELFSQKGRTVTEVRLVTDRDTGRPRGFGFVEMGSNEDADGAIRDLNGTDFGGRSLTVNEARERTAGGGGGRGGFGGGGGYGGGGGGRGGNRRY
jgi:RNA recognition motif-containing protein